VPEWSDAFQERRQQKKVTTSDLLAFCYQIASGMTFLQEKHVSNHRGSPIGVLGVRGYGGRGRKSKTQIPRGVGDPNLKIREGVGNSKNLHMVKIQYFEKFKFYPKITGGTPFWGPPSLLGRAGPLGLQP
jgi:hypothetical protein